MFGEAHYMPVTSRLCVGHSSDVSTKAGTQKSTATVFDKISPLLPGLLLTVSNWLV
jgi:hypothetical protein